MGWILAIISISALVWLASFFPWLWPVYNTEEIEQTKNIVEMDATLSFQEVINGGKVITHTKILDKGVYEVLLKNRLKHSLLNLDYDSLYKNLDKTGYVSKASELINCT